MSQASGTGRSAIPKGQLLLLILGFCLWASALVLVYAVHSIGCIFGWETAALRAALAVVLLLNLALIGGSWRRHVRADAATGDTGSFLQSVTLWTLISAFVTAVFTLGPVLLLETCI